jgi:hypothetical protein
MSAGERIDERRSLTGSDGRPYNGRVDEGNYQCRSVPINRSEFRAAVSTAS